MKLKLVAYCVGIAISSVSGIALAADVALSYDTSLQNVSADIKKVDMKVDSSVVGSQTLDASTTEAKLQTSETRVAFPKSVSFDVYKEDAAGAATLVTSIACPVDRAMAAKANAPGLRDRYTIAFTVDVAARACKSQIIQVESAEGAT